MEAPLISPLLPMLDSTGEAFFGVDEQTEPIIKSKLEINRILTFCFDCRQEARVSMAFDKYTELFEKSIPPTSDGMMNRDDRRQYHMFHGDEAKQIFDDG